MVFNLYPLSAEASQLISAVEVVGDGCILEGFSEESAEGTTICSLGPGSYDIPIFRESCPENAIKSWQGGCPSQAPAPSPTGCEDNSGTCTVAEDPHIDVFDGAFISLLATSNLGNSMNDESAGDKWLVKSKYISIQARYMPNDELPDRNLFVRAIAVGGEFLKGNKMIIASLEEESKWNTQTILEKEDSTFIFQEEGLVVDAVRSGHSLLVEDLSKENRGVTIKLPLGLTLIVNRLHKHVNVAIRMCAQEGGQEGLCGNFNGIASDDSWEMSSVRLDTNVRPAESLFAETM